MKKITIVRNELKPGSHECSEKLAKIIKNLGGMPTEICGSADIPVKDTELYISLGGDGSLLHLAGKLLESEDSTPIMGINIGHTGYMSSIDMEKCTDDEIAKIIEGRYRTEDRAVIRCRLVRKGKTVFEKDVLNDIAVFRGAQSHISEFLLYENGRKAATYLSDGVIFSTPTGSTAYSLSAGGPIVDPSMSGIIVTPVCAHNLSARTIVFSKRSKLSLTVRERTDSTAYLQSDGETGAKLEDGDEITVMSSPLKVKLLLPEDTTFFDIVNGKLI